MKTSEELGRILVDRQARHKRALTNLQELMDNISYKLLTDKKVQGNLVGISRDRIVPALGAMNELWGLLPRLSTALKEAADKHANLSRFFQDKELAAIDELLTGQSIQITEQIPFAQRNLSDPSVKVSTMSIDQVLDLIDPIYAAARDVVMEVDKVFNTLLVKADEVDAVLNEATTKAASLDPASTPLVVQLQERCRKARAACLADPLSIGSDYADAIKTEADALLKKLEGFITLKQEAEAQVKNAPAMLATLKDTYANAQAAEAERKLKVTGFPLDTMPALFGESVFNDAPLGLVPWLARLEKTLAEGNWRACQVGINNWEMHCQQRQEQATQVLNANLAPVNRRRELRGLIDALAAKAAQMQVVEKPKLSGIYKELSEILYARPTNLGRAEELVKQYASILHNGSWD